MRLSPRAFALTAALFLGGSTFLIGVLHLLDPYCGADYLRAISSVYPGFNASRSVTSVIIGAVYGLVDGAFAGFLFAWACNFPAARLEAPPS